MHYYHSAELQTNRKIPALNRVVQTLLNEKQLVSIQPSEAKNNMMIMGFHGQGAMPWPLMAIFAAEKHRGYCFCYRPLQTYRQTPKTMPS